MDIDVLHRAVRQLLDFKEKAEKDIEALKDALGVSESVATEPSANEAKDGKNSGRK